MCIISRTFCYSVFSICKWSDLLANKLVLVKDFVNNSSIQVIPPEYFVLDTGNSMDEQWPMPMTWSDHLYFLVDHLYFLVDPNKLISKSMEIVTQWATINENLLENPFLENPLNALGLSLICYDENLALIRDNYDENLALIRDNSNRGTKVRLIDSIK